MSATAARIAQPLSKTARQRAILDLVRSRPIRTQEELVGLLEKALREKSRLGEVVVYLNDLLGKLPKRPTPLVILDDDQKARRVGLPR